MQMQMRNEVQLNLQGVLVLLIHTAPIYTTWICTPPFRPKLFGNTKLSGCCSTVIELGIDLAHLRRGKRHAIQYEGLT